jgi:hypothetical protein
VPQFTLAEKDEHINGDIRSVMLVTAAM